MPDGTDAGWGDVAPANSPVQVTGLLLVSGMLIGVQDVTGEVNNCPWGPGFNADGNPDDIQGHLGGAALGKSDMVAPLNCLVGIFLDDGTPSGTPPAGLNFSTAASRDYTALAPALAQPFCFGDGKTSTGAQQRVRAPEGATRLFVATMDSFESCSNWGSFTVEIGVIEEGNLLRNPGAEEEMAYWTSNPSGLVVSVTEAGEASGTVEPNSGSRFFSFLGFASAFGNMYQEVDLAGLGATQLRAGGRIQTEGLGTPPDCGRMDLIFYDSGGTYIRSATTGIIGHPALGYEYVGPDGFGDFGLTAEVPPGAARLRCVCLGIRRYGSWINTFYDDLYLRATDYDTDPPAISIDSPAGGAVVHEYTVGVKGTASDDSGISEVIWRNRSTGETGTVSCSGASEVTWTCDIPLRIGDNAIVATAIDGCGNQASAEATVKCAPPMTIRGIVRYKPYARRSENNPPPPSLPGAGYVWVEVWEKNTIPTLEPLSAGYTDPDGKFEFTKDLDGDPIYNLDDGSLESGTRDLYFRVHPRNDCAEVVSPIPDLTYLYTSRVYQDVRVADFPANLPPILSTAWTSNHAEAYGIPGYLANLQLWFMEEFSWLMTSTVSVSYPSWMNGDPNGLYELILVTEESVSNHTLAHEYGHAMHHEVHGYLLPGFFDLGKPDPHTAFTEFTPGFAVSEGWAELVRYLYAGHLNDLANANGPFDYENGYENEPLPLKPFWMGDEGAGARMAGPNTTGNTGDIVEGAVTSVLCDLCDPADDDGVDSSATEVWDVFRVCKPNFIWNEEGNEDFYHCWNNLFGQSREVDEIFLDHGVPVIDDDGDWDDGNDDPGHAFPLGVLTGEHTYTNLIVTDPDWYEIEVPADRMPRGSIVEVAIAFRRTRGRIELSVYRRLAGGGIEALPRDQYELDVSDDGDDRTIALAADLRPGKYCILVNGAGDNLQAGTYETGDKYEGDFSPNYTLTVLSTPKPSITALLPTTVKAGGGPFNLLVYGLNFMPGSKVWWNGAMRPTVYVPAGDRTRAYLSAGISAQDIAAPGQARIAVSNPSPKSCWSEERRLIVRP
jgi:hypothetical protein